MKVLITGATGFVGKKLVEHLASQGHQIVALSRSRKRAQSQLPTSCKVWEWDPLNKLVPANALVDVDVVVNLMGENISTKRWSAKQREKIFQSRVQGTENLVQSIQQYGHKVKSVISTSAIGIYPVNSNDELAEDAVPASSGFLAQLCNAWEQALAPLSHLRVVIIRVGVVLGDKGGMLGKLLPIFKMGGGGRIGRGEHFMSWIHIRDLVHLYTAAVENTTFRGIYNGVSPRYVTNKQFTQALSRSLGMPAYFPVPPWMLKILFGEMSTIMLDSQKIISRRFQQIPRPLQFPTIQQALDDICQK